MRLIKLTSILLSALMNSKEAVLRQGKIGHLMITSPQHLTDIFCSKVEGKLTFHRVSQNIA